MPRQPRVDLANTTQHVIQRGNNRESCFRSSEDRRCYLDWLRDTSRELDISLHAYVLMDNHVHLLATGKHTGAIGRMMQRLGRRYVRYFNAKHDRTGTLWEGRYRSCLVDSDHYVLACYRYIELNPVRAGMVADPGRFRWSSFLNNAHGNSDGLIAPHPTYLSLGRSPSERRRAYRGLFEAAVGDEELAAIRRHVHTGKVFGSEAFIRRIETGLDRPLRLRRPGRPKKNAL